MWGGAVVDTVPRERVKHSELDFPVYVYEDDDCDCGGEFDEACCCKACGEYADENEMVNGFLQGLCFDFERAVRNTDEPIHAGRSARQSM